MSGDTEGCGWHTGHRGRWGREGTLAPKETFCLPGFVSFCVYSVGYVWCLHVCTCVLRPEDSGTFLYGSAIFS